MPLPASACAGRQLDRSCTGMVGSKEIGVARKATDAEEWLADINDQVLMIRALRFRLHTTSYEVSRQERRDSEADEET